MKPGVLLKVPVETTFLEANPNRWAGIRVLDYPFIFCIEEMNMTKEWQDMFTASVSTHLQVKSTSNRVAGWATVVWNQSRATTRHQTNDIFEKAEYEYIKTGMIKGYKFLCLNNSKFIWISHYDVQVL